MKKIIPVFIQLLLPFFAVSQNLVSISPSGANNGQTLNVTITGTNTHFIQGSGTTTTVGFSSGQGVGTPVVNSKTILNDSSIIANISVPVNANTGYYNVYTNNPTDGYRSLNNGFYVNGTAPGSLVSISPSVTNANQTLNVTITGAKTHFTQGSGTISVGFTSSQGIGNPVVNSKTIINDSSIIANITIPASAYTGYYTAFVSNTTDGYHSLNNGFHVNGITHPSLVSISPAGANPGQTLNVTITGTLTHFTQASGTTSVTCTSSQGFAPSVNYKTIVNDSSIIANITIPQSADIGTCNLSVYNSATGSLHNDFFVFDNCFSHYTTDYNITNNTFSLTLDSLTSASGLNFYWNFGDGTNSTSQTPSHTFLLDTVYNVCLKITTNSGDTCSYCHMIGKNFFGEIFRQTGFLMNVTNFNGTTTTGLSQIGNNEGVTSIIAYPNPANELITITTNPIVAIYKPILSLYSMEGQLLLQQLFIQGKTVLDISGFSKGIYVIKITGTEKTEVIKFVKQ